MTSGYEIMLAMPQQFVPSVLYLTVQPCFYLSLRGFNHSKNFHHTLIVYRHVSLQMMATADHSHTRWVKTHHVKKIAHEQTIICRQLFAVISANEKEEKHASNDNKLCLHDHINCYRHCVKRVLKFC